MFSTGSGGVQRCRPGQVPGSLQLQQASAGVDHQQTGTQTQTGVQPGTVIKKPQIND